jgi:FemAB-related protein (PEP-CTERM system-associated)
VIAAAPVLDSARPTAGLLPVQVREMADGEAGRWDAFVDGCADATFFHLSGWKPVIERSFGQRAYYLWAFRGEQCCGLLPLVHMRSRLFGNSLVSLPFCVYGGPLASDADALDALLARARTLAEELGVSTIELRSMRRATTDWACQPDLYATFIRDLPSDPDAVLTMIPRKQRAVVRKALGSDLVAAPDDDVERVYDVYAESVRNLGTPVFPRRYFRNLRAVFGERCTVMTVSAGRRAVASVLNFEFRDTVLPYYGGGLPVARGLGAADLMYYTVMRHAAESGLKRYDFGRSKAGTGAFAFKKNWGFEPRFLEYEFHLPPGAAIPDKNPLSPKYRLFIAAWRRLPLAFANRLGPLIVRGIG